MTEQHPPAPQNPASRLETGVTRLQLMGTYTHQIKNHLTVILGGCELALTPGADAATIAEQLAHIRASALTISALTKALEPLQN